MTTGAHTHAPEQDANSWYEWSPLPHRTQHQAPCSNPASNALTNSVMEKHSKTHRITIQENNTRPPRSPQQSSLQQQQQKSLWQKKEKRMPKGFLMPAGCSCRFRTFGLGCCRLGHAATQFQTRTKPKPKGQQNEEELLRER